MDWINIISWILGVAFVTLTKLRSLQVLTGKANVCFSYKKYFEQEAVGIITSLLSIAIWQVLFSEVAVKYPQLDTFIKTSFFLMGASGAWIIQKLLGKTQSWINAKIDKKTNELDEIKSNQPWSHH